MDPETNAHTAPKIVFKKGDLLSSASLRSRFMD